MSSSDTTSETNDNQQKGLHIFGYVIPWTWVALIIVVILILLYYFCEEKKTTSLFPNSTLNNNLNIETPNELRKLFSR